MFANLGSVGHVCNPDFGRIPFEFSAGNRKSPTRNRVDRNFHLRSIDGSCSQYSSNVCKLDPDRYHVMTRSEREHPVNAPFGDEFSINIVNTERTSNFPNSDVGTAMEILDGRIAGT